MKFFSTAPVLAFIWFTLTAGFLVELQRFFPDVLFYPF
ncbi:MAG: Photosystem I reaction center subunit IX [Acaryochloris sp. RU_4_1]|nr:Photosystem I reaction center subunit IX [Acaryochloris sp. RU_4_1]NJN38070.1 Photosystem I reaction center subunit IX [Acaryochloridaceae cyanobacterium CSU_3_4]NJR54262.1 Photosystem I reaction center subunit IX [Acaryochloris sp. CRU_2_0]